MVMKEREDGFDVMCGVRKIIFFRKNFFLILKKIYSKLNS
jgi:hypothetical protein